MCTEPPNLCLLHHRLGGLNRLGIGGRKSCRQGFGGQEASQAGDGSSGSHKEAFVAPTISADRANAHFFAKVFVARQALDHGLRRQGQQAACS